MATGLLFECDEQVALWLFDKMGWPVYKYDRAIGIVNDKAQLVGAVLFQHWNGCNVELSYYGEKTMTAGVVRCLARFTLLIFNPSRLTVNTSKKNKRFIKALHRLGFRLEGASRCFYGMRDCNRNTAVRLVAFREDIEHVARYKEYEPDVDDAAPAGNRLLPKPINVQPDPE